MLIAKTSSGSELHIGTAAWANPPAQAKRRRGADSHLHHYARNFDAVEINSSFYRAHQRSTYERWRRDTPVDFSFAVKMPRSITHDSGLRGCRSEMIRFLSEVSGLGRKLKVLLIQLPPSLELDTRVANRFFKLLRSLTRVSVVCEPRHAGWFTAKADALLRRHRIGRVGADPSRVPGGDEPGGDPRILYYRLHGSPRIYYSAYTRAFLRQLACRIECAGARQKIWCLFDNTARHAAWTNARQLQRILGSA